jgi:hypothetical protein
MESNVGAIGREYLPKEGTREHLISGQAHILHFNVFMFLLIPSAPTLTHVGGSCLMRWADAVRCKTL